MNVKFKNNETLVCTAPTETMLFRASMPYGWLLRFSVTSSMTSNELNELLTEDNISSLTFIPDVVVDEEATEGDSANSDSNIAKELVLTDYKRISSVIVHHGESAPTRIEIQLTKGVVKDGN